MNTTFKKALTIFIIFAVTVCFAVGMSASVNTTNELAKIKIYITENKIQPQTAEETVIFAKTGLIYGDIAEFIPSVDKTDPESLADMILVLAAIEKTPEEYAENDFCAVLAGLQQENGSFGGFKETCKAMIALKATGTVFDSTKGAEFIMDFANENGSICETDDVFYETYLAVTVLSPYRSTSSAVTETMKKAAEFVKTEFTSENSAFSPTEIANAIMIITDLGGDPDEDTYGRLLEKLLNYQNLDGSGTFYVDDYGKTDRTATVRAMRALDAVSYGASDLKTLSEMGKFSTGIDLEGLKPFLTVLAIMAGLSVIMWIIVFAVKKPKTQTLEEYKASVENKQTTSKDEE